MIESELFKKLLKREQEELSSFLTIAKLSGWEISLHEAGYHLSRGTDRLKIIINVYGRVHRKVRNVIRFELFNVNTFKKNRINQTGVLSNSDVIKEATFWL